MPCAIKSSRSGGLFGFAPGAAVIFFLGCHLEEVLWWTQEVTAENGVLDLTANLIAYSTPDASIMKNGPLCEREILLMDFRDANPERWGRDSADSTSHSLLATTSGVYAPGTIGLRQPPWPLRFVHHGWALDGPVPMALCANAPILTLSSPARYRRRSQR